MNTVRIVFALLGLSLSADAAINTILKTTLSANITQTQTCFNVASATGITAGSFNDGTVGSNLYIADLGQKGEVVTVQRLTGTQVCVLRADRATRHNSGAMVLVATAPNWFQYVDPQGAVTSCSNVFVSPWVNVTSGAMFECSSKTLSWVPYWGTATSETAQVLSATATASVAGATAITGPFSEISGTEAITSFTMSTGWNGQGFCVYPTAAFTGTATNNIAKAFTAVADRVLCFAYNANSSKFSPSY